MNRQQLCQSCRLVSHPVTRYVLIMSQHRVSSTAVGPIIDPINMALFHSVYLRKLRELYIAQLFQLFLSSLQKTKKRLRKDQSGFSFCSAASIRGTRRSLQMLSFKFLLNFQKYW